MARRVYLHVGTPKSGTKYLQSLLHANRDTLRGRGVLYPGHRPFDQILASLDVRHGRHLPASAEPATTAACPPGHVEHPVEGCIPLPPGPY